MLESRALNGKFEIWCNGLSAEYLLTRTQLVAPSARRTRLAGSECWFLLGRGLNLQPFVNALLNQRRAVLVSAGEAA